jgi:hypothetical protein
MIANSVHRRVFAAVALLLACLTSGSALAEQNNANFKVGDRVEVKQFDQWKPGKVVSVDKQSGWIDVRLDESDLPASFPKEMRERARTQKFVVSDLRRAARPATKAAAAAANPIRKWTDRSNKFSIEARFEGLDGGNVKLIKADGKHIAVPLDKLADDDATYARDEAKKVEENPFKETSADDEAVAADHEDEASEAPAKKGVWKGVKTVKPQSFKAWSFKPVAPATALGTASAAEADLLVPLGDIPDSKKFFEKVDGIYPSKDGARVIVGRDKGDVGEHLPAYLQIVEAGKSGPSELIALPEATALLDVDADSSLVMYRPAIFGFGKNNVLTMAKPEGGKLTTVERWEPYSEEDYQPHRDIGNAWFLGPNRILTHNRDGEELTVWDTEHLKALINIPVLDIGELKAAISPDHTLLAVVMKEGIAIIDLAAGKHVATIPTGGQDYRAVAFQADNSHLAGLTTDILTVWDLTTGKETRSINVVQNFFEHDLKWANDFLLVNNRHLYDVDHRVLLWDYHGSMGQKSQGAVQSGRLFVVPTGDEKSETTVFSTAVPHAPALEMLKSLPSADALLVVKPGDEVAIDVDIDPSVTVPDDVRKSLEASIRSAARPGDDGKVVFLNQNRAAGDLVRKALAASLEAAGLKVVNHADLVVKVVCKPERQQKLRINVDRRFPVRPGDFVERTITPHASTMEMSLKGETLWTRGYVARPGGLIIVNEGETLDQCLQRLSQPNLQLFSNFKFSGYVARPGKATRDGAYGVSQFTSQGLVDGKSADGSKNGVFE